MIKEAIFYEYSHWDASENDLYTLTDTLVDVLSDHEYVTPAVQMAKYLSRAQVDVFFYVFGHKSKNDIYPKWAGKETRQMGSGLGYRKTDHKSDERIPI